MSRGITRAQRTCKVHVAHLFRLILLCWEGGDSLSCTFQSVCVISRRVRFSRIAVPCSAIVSSTWIWRNLSSFCLILEFKMHLYWKAKNIFGDFAADGLPTAAVPRSTFLASAATASTTQLELEEVQTAGVVGRAPSSTSSRNSRCRILEVGFFSRCR